MAAPVEIVIQATDRFSPVFEHLAAAFRQAESGGKGAGRALEGLQGALREVSRRSAETGARLAGVAAEAEQRFAALAESEQASLQARAAQQTAATERLGERLLAIDQASAARRAALRGQELERERAARADHLAGLSRLEQEHHSQVLAVEKSLLDARLRNHAAFSEALRTLAAGRGRALARLAKTAAIAEALINAYLAGTKALASVPFPFNLAAAAAVTAQGLATVERIRQVNVAHGGLENVPEDATFLLRRGERVLAPEQNRDLTRFLSGAGERPSGEGVTISNLTIHVLENATNAEALLAMEPSELRRVVMERILPTLDELAALGIQPRFVDSNT